MPNSHTAQLQSWIDQLKAGDDSARERLIQHSTQRLEKLTHAMFRRYPDLRRWEQTADVFQHVLIRFYRALSTTELTSVREFLSLATTVIRSVLIDLWRHYFGPEGLAAHHDTMHPGATDTPLANAADKSEQPAELSEWVEFHQKVDTLPDEEREIVDLLYYQGLTQRESASLLNVSERTVKRRWQAARIMLYHAVKSYAR